MRRAFSPRAGSVPALVLLTLAVAACEPQRLPTLPGEYGTVPLSITATLQDSQIAAIVVRVTATDIPTPLVFDLTISSGTASATLKIPPGLARTIQATAFDAQGDTAADGSITLNVSPGNNPSAHLVLSARGGHVPIILTVGSYTVAVTPTSTGVLMPDSVQLTVTVTDANGHAVSNPAVSWASSQPTVATVSAAGLVKGVAIGSAQIVTTYEGVAALSTITVFRRINVPSANYTYASGIDNLGRIVGEYNGTGNWDHGFLYDGTTFTTLDYPGTGPNGGGQWKGTAASAINDSGVIVGTHGPTSLGVPYGFTYTGGTFTAMPTAPCALATQASGVNNGAQIVGSSELSSSGCYPGGSNTSNPLMGYLYSGGSFTALAPSGSVAGMALGISNLGQVVGNYYDASSNGHGYLYAGGSFTTIDVPGGTNTQVRGINVAGQLVGSYVGSDTKTHAFVRTGGTFTTFDVPGATWTTAYDINDLGQVVGSYTDAGGVTHGFETKP